MVRFRGAIGYASDSVTAPGVHKEAITEVSYFGDVTRALGRLEPSTEQVNDNLGINNAISVLADAFANENIAAMRYVSWNGSRWKITSVEVRRPRLILSIGELWNGSTP